MSENQALAVRTNTEEQALLRVSDVKGRLDAVIELMKSVMKPADLAKGVDGDYGVIPGTGTKPTLLKPGAEKLCTLFRLSPTSNILIREMPHLAAGHREYVVTVTLTHIPTQTVWGQGEGSASTAESKHRWRKSERKCPLCEAGAIKKSKYPPKGMPPGTPPGWYCYDKLGGCGAEFPAGDVAIESQEVGRSENPDIADTYNAVLKVAKKRALVAAILVTTGASAMFSQDLDDNANDETPPPARTHPQTNGNGHAPPKPTAKPSPAKVATNPEDNNKVFEDRITGLREVSRNKPDAPKKWTLYEITTANNGPLAFFSDTIKAQAEMAMAEEAVVSLVWAQGDKGPLLKEINAIHEAEFVEQQ